MHEFPLNTNKVPERKGTYTSCGLFGVATTIACAVYVFPTAGEGSFQANRPDQMGTPFTAEGSLPLLPLGPMPPGLD